MLMPFIDSYRLHLPRAFDRNTDSDNYMAGFQQEPESESGSSPTKGLRDRSQDGSAKASR